jgi:hypothetical protein
MSLVKTIPILRKQGFTATNKSYQFGNFCLILQTEWHEGDRESCVERVLDQ